MTIFGESRLGRVAYAVVLILMFCFDFVKTPVEHYIIARQDEVTRLIAAPRPVDPSSQPMNFEINGHAMPPMMKGQQEVLRSIVASGQKPTAEDVARFRTATEVGVAKMMLLGPDTDPETARLGNERSFYQVLFFAAIIAMTGVTIVGLLWMVSSRLRDIGAPQYWLWVLLTPVFLPKFVHLPLPDLAFQIVGVLFYGALLALALVPAKDSGPLLPPRRFAPEPVPIKPRPGQFGRRGMS